MNKQSHTMVYLVRRFRLWKIENKPDLSDKEALKLYTGIEISEVHKQLVELNNWPLYRKVGHLLRYGWW